MRIKRALKLLIIIACVIFVCGNVFAQERSLKDLNWEVMRASMVIMENTGNGKSWKDLDQEVMRLLEGGKYREGIRIGKEALQVAEKKYGANHPNTATSLNNLAMLYQSLGRYSDALPLHKRALEIREKVLGKEHPSVATSLNNLALLYSAQGKYSDALPLFKGALEIVKKSFGKKHPYVAITLDNLAELYKSEGRYSDAEPLYKRALAIKEKVLGKEHPQVATSLNNLAELYYAQGRYSYAEPLYKRALAIKEKVLGKEHPDIATSLNNLALLYYTQGRYSDAEPLYKKALKIYEKALGKNHPSVATSLNNLAGLYNSQGRYSSALPLYKRALKICEKALGKNHPYVANSLNSLAGLYFTQGRYSNALPLYKRALEIREKALGKEHPDVAQSLNNIALLYSTQGRYSEAEPLYKRAVEIYEKALGKEHPSVATSLNNLAFLFVAVGRKADALPLMKKALSIDENVIRDVFTLASEREKFMFLATVQGKYECFMSLVCMEIKEKPDALISGMNAVLRRKGIVLESLMGERKTLMESGSPEVQKVYKKLYQVTSLISSLTLAGPGKMSMEQYRKKIKKLESQREKLEKELTRMSKEYASEKRSRSADCESVSRKLPAGSVLVEYVNIHPFDFKAKGMEMKWGQPEYFVFILPSDKNLPKGKKVSPKLVSLGKASVIDEAVKEFRMEIVRTRKLWENRILDESAAEKRLAKKGRRIYELVIAPIRKAIGENKTIYIAPDGDLNLIPFDALQDETGHYLVEKYKLNYISSGRDLLRWEGKATAGNETFIIADPDFDMSGSDRASAARGILSEGRKVAIDRGGRSIDLTQAKWNRLPGTRKEAEEIKKIIRGEKMVEYLDKSALEEVVKSIKSPTRLHIATHGFFLEDLDDTILLKSGMERSLRMDSRGGAFGRIPIKMENPLLRSGLVLAGANRLGREKLPEGCGDGILTALEISGMNLRGTDLVVLSACETGVGKTHRGEGVFGLRRAFQLAGARTVVMSLWSVPDKQTQELMVDYYGRIKNGEGKSKALRNTMLSIIQERRKKSGASHPFFWASFISVGEP
ncbi:MAG: tetratricopeptide repeat protein [Candidatus Eremiobacteraeota bacterium]|nr:tetratricopeptide repeat protein [Candidatus Eremiobacteraeota bacterium]